MLHLCVEFYRIECFNHNKMRVCLLMSGEYSSTSSHNKDVHEFRVISVTWNTKLQRKNWKLQKKMQRGSESRKTARKAEPSEQERSPKTPRSKATASIRRAGMSPRAVPHAIRKQLIFAHAVSDEVRQAVEKGPQNSNTRRGLSASVVSGGSGWGDTNVSCQLKFWLFISCQLNLRPFVSCQLIGC